jgi:hypothetical protein
MKDFSRQLSCFVIMIMIGLLGSACGAERVPSSDDLMGDGDDFLLIPTPSRTPFQPSLSPDLSIEPNQPVDAQSQTLGTGDDERQTTPSASESIDTGELPAVYLAPYIPDSIKQALVFPNDLDFASDNDRAQIWIEVGDQNPLSRWIYALVAPFPTIPEGVTFDELLGVWRGKDSATFPGARLLMDEKTSNVFEAAWGPSAANAVNILLSEDLVDYAWEHQPVLALIPFESLEPRWKVLEVDGLSPIRKEFAADNYPLAISFSIISSTEEGTTLSREILNLSPTIPSSNRFGDKMTTVAMTGVTAMVRCTAYYMEQHGITYPGQDVRELLLDADITHVSNEIPFVKGCPFPNCFQEGLVFCSDPKYVGLLTDIGTDVVELTGDHFADWGSEAMLYTLELYRKSGLPYYGGGANWEDGSQPVILEHNGNRLAFIGCNGKGGWYATARADNPGAVSCDFETMHADISRLRADGYLPIATFQHIEYYTYQPQPNMQADFQGMAEAGALIVSGSQAHQPHGMEFIGASFLHYGLGNLFFDQFGYCPERACDDAFIDRHVFYDGRYIATELIPIRFVDWARPRLMTPEEKKEFLQIIFSASGWLEK